MFEGTFPESDGATNHQGLGWNDDYSKLVTFNKETNQYELNENGLDVARWHVHLGQNIKIQGASNITLQQYLAQRPKFFQALEKRIEHYNRMKA